MSKPQPKPFAVLFGMVIALVLLLLYAYTTLYMIQAVRCDADDSDGCESPTVADITEGMIFINTTVSGLVAALVVSELAITKPGEAPGARALTQDSSLSVKRVANGVAAVYIAVWVLVGLSALIFGVMFYEGVIETLTNAGTTWLGLAVAAGYSYFGIRPQGG